MANNKLILTVFFLLLQRPVFCQVVAIQLDKMNILYTCIENPFTIVVDGYSSKDLVLTTDNGEIKPIHPWGGGIIIPQHTGTATISVNIKTQKGLKEIKKAAFRVKERPLPTVKLDGRHGGEINKNILCAQIAPGASYDFADYRVRILSFKVVIRRDTDEIFNRTMADSKGTRIDSVTKNIFWTLRRNDKVFFTDLLVEDCDSSFRYLEPMLFIISETAYEEKPGPLPDKQIILTDPVTGDEVRHRY